MPPVNFSLIVRMTAFVWTSVSRRNGKTPCQLGSSNRLVNTAGPMRTALKPRWVISLPVRL